MKNIEPKKKIIKGFKKTPEIKEKIEEMNAWIRENGWKKVLPGDDFWKYEPISKYKDELGISGKKANEYLEKMGYIVRKEISVDKNGKTKKVIILTEKGKKFGKQMLNLVIIEKDKVYVLKVEKYVVWSPQIVDEIKRFLEKGEEKNGDTK